MFLALYSDPWQTLIEFHITCLDFGLCPGELYSCKIEFPEEWKECGHRNIYLYLSLDFYTTFQTVRASWGSSQYYQHALLAPQNDTKQTEWGSPCLVCAAKEPITTSVLSPLPTPTVWEPLAGGVISHNLRYVWENWDHLWLKQIVWVSPTQSQFARTKIDGRIHFYHQYFPWLQYVQLCRAAPWEENLSHAHRCVWRSQLTTGQKFQAFDQYMRSSLDLVP